MPETVEYIVEAEHDVRHDVTLQNTGSSLAHVLDGVIDLLAGTAGGIACVYSGQPLDTVKVKMQTFSHLYTNSYKCLRETFVKDGIRGLYAGTVPALAANIAENSILFCAYGFCQKWISMMVRKEGISELNPLENACAGSMAAVFSSFALCPTELVKCRLQALREMRTTGEGSMGHSQGQKYGPWSVCKDIFRTDGFRGFFRGLTPTFAREVPGYFFFFGGYELSRHYLTPAGKSKDEIGVLRTALCGGVGGVTLWVLIFPADVVKSQVQVQGHGKFIPLLISIVKTSGVRGLYKGLGPTIVRSFFATGALFVAYEYSRKWMHSMVR